MTSAWIDSVFCPFRGAPHYRKGITRIFDNKTDSGRRAGRLQKLRAGGLASTHRRTAIEMEAGVLGGNLGDTTPTMGERATPGRPCCPPPSPSSPPVPAAGAAEELE